MRYFLDEEFIEDGRTIDLVSIALVAEDGRAYYAQNAEADHTRASEWVQVHVLKQLDRCPGHSYWSDWAYHNALGGRCSGGVTCPWRSRKQLRDEVLAFVDPEQHGAPQFWGYYADYDWVALCQLFGTMMDLPPGWPMYCRDLKQWADMLGNPSLPEQGKGEHHALADARWELSAWTFLRMYEIQHPSAYPGAWA